MLGAQPPDQLAEDDAQIAGDGRWPCVGVAICSELDRQTEQFACIFSTGADDDRYKWIALSNTTLGVLLATLDASITLIAMPDIFRGISSTRSCPATASTCCG